MLKFAFGKTKGKHVEFLCGFYCLMQSYTIHSKIKWNAIAAKISVKRMRPKICSLASRKFKMLVRKLLWKWFRHLITISNDKSNQSDITHILQRMPIMISNVSRVDVGKCLRGASRATNMQRWVEMEWKLGCSTIVESRMHSCSTFNEWSN